MLAHVSARPARPHRLRVLLVPVLVALLASGGVTPASAKNDIDRRVAAASDDLAAASRAVTKANAALVRAAALLPAARAQAQAAAADLASARATYSTARAAARSASTRAAQAQERLAAAKARIADMNGQIGDLARAVYQQGPYAELAGILSATTPSDFADQIQAIRSVSQQQNRLLADLEAARADLALRGLQAQQALDAARASQGTASAALASASTAAARARAAQARVAALVSARAHAFTVARHQRASVKRQYLELRREQARLRAIEHGGGGYTGPVSGELFWPIPGAPVVQGVGPRIHPVYGYKSCHTGDDIRGTYGTPIHAAADGRVLAVLNEGAYGLHTLISHGGSLSTMYAHQSRTVVSAGQVVRRGQVIGYVGASGWVTGPHLHFEVHVGGVPYDPQGWFGGSKVPVSCWNG